MHAVGLLSVGGSNRKRRRRKVYALRGRVSQNDVTLLRKLTRSGGPRLRCSRSVGGKENVINHLVVFNGRAGQRSNSFFLSFFQVYFSSQQSKQFCHIARGLHKLSPLLQLLVSLFSFFLSFSLSHSPLSLPPVCVLNSLVSCCWLIPRTALHLLRLRLLVVVATVTTFFFFSFFELVVLQSLKRTGSHRSTTGWGAQVKGGGGDGRSSGRARSCDARIFICCRVGVMKCCSSPCWLVSTRLDCGSVGWHGARCTVLVIRLINREGEGSAQRSTDRPRHSITVHSRPRRVGRVQSGSQQWDGKSFLFLPFLLWLLSTLLMLSNNRPTR